MSEELSYGGKAAAGYDGAFAQVTTHFVPFLLRAAHITPGMRVLDIATGTGLAAEAALSVVGSAGHVTAADLSPAMAEKARARLGQARNASVTVEDGQALSFLDGSFDAVVCSLGLMFFPDPQRGLTEFHRVLRPGGRAAVSVSTVPERSYNTRISLSIARYLPSLAEAAARVSSLGDEMKLKSLFEAANFRDVEITTETRSFALPSFDARAHRARWVSRWRSGGRITATSRWRHGDRGTDPGDGERGCWWFFFQRREDFFLPGIIFFTDRLAALAAFLTFRTAREIVDDLFFAVLAMAISSIWIS